MGLATHGGTGAAAEHAAASRCVLGPPIRTSKRSQICPRSYLRHRRGGSSGTSEQTRVVVIVHDEARLGIGEGQRSRFD